MTATVLFVISPGSSALYATRLRERYLKGVPLCSTIYGATEGLIGVNLWPLDPGPSYLLVARSMFFEFIPIQQSNQEQPKVKSSRVVMFLIQYKQREFHKGCRLISVSLVYGRSATTPKRRKNRQLYLLRVIA